MLRPTNLFKTFAFLLLAVGQNALSVAAQEVQLGPQGPVIISSGKEKPRPPELIQSNPQEARVSRIGMRAAAAPSPALRYILIPDYADIKPGNAVPFYYRAIMRLGDIDPKIISRMQTLAKLPASKLDLAEADQTLKFFSGVLDELRIAVHRERCDWDWRLRDRTGEGQTTFILQEIQEMRDFGRLLSLQSAVSLARRDFDASVESLMMGYRLAQDVGRPGILVNDLVGIAIAGVMNARVVDFIDTQGSPNLYWAIASLPRPLVSMRDGFQHERLLPYAFFPFLRDAETRNLSQDAWTRLLNEHLKAFRRIVGDNPSHPMAPATIVASSYPRAKRELIAEGYSRERIDGMPAAQVIAIHEAKVLRRVSDDLFKWSLLPYHEADGWTKTVRIYSFDPFREQAESLPIGSQLLPAVMAAASSRSSPAHGARRLAYGGSDPHADAREWWPVARRARRHPSRSCAEEPRHQQGVHLSPSRCRGRPCLAVGTGQGSTRTEYVEH